MKSLVRALTFAVSFATAALAATPAFAEADDYIEQAEDPGEKKTAQDKWPDVRDWLRLNLGPLRLSPVVLMQVQGVPYVGADSLLQAGDASESGGFRFRRARFGFDGRLYRRVPFRITAEFNSDERGPFSIRDAWFGYDRWKPLQVFAGAMNVPFSRSSMADSGGNALIERPLAVRAMAPFYQLGVAAQGRFFSGALNYNVGVYNGLQRTDQFFRGFIEHAALSGNRFDGLTYAARLSSDPLGPLGRTIQDFYKGDLRIGMGANLFFSNGGTRNITGIGGDVLMHWKGFHLHGEFLTNHTAPRTVPTQPSGQISTVRALAAVGELGYMIFRERLGVTARFEWLNPNTSVKDEADNVLIVGGLSYHVLHDLLKAQLDYTHRRELYGKPLKNDSLVFQLQLNL